MACLLAEGWAPLEALWGRVNGVRESRVRMGAWCHGIALLANFAPGCGQLDADRGTGLQHRLARLLREGAIEHLRVLARNVLHLVHARVRLVQRH
jgi:hypothetical protein